ncbi:MAG: hypothetical protein Q9185_000610 [Variospora sp. 1 TL-2023]
MDRESGFAPSTPSYGAPTPNDGASIMSGIPSSSMSVDPSQGAAQGPSQASSATVRGNPMRQAVRTEKAPPPLPFFEQAIICQGMVYCSGQVGLSPVTKQLVDGGVGDRTAEAGEKE